MSFVSFDIPRLRAECRIKNLKLQLLSTNQSLVKGFFRCAGNSERISNVEIKLLF